MRTRAKALTVAAAMVLTFAILPTFGAAAAEPLEDGSYDVTVEDATYTVDVVDGQPAVEGAEGVEFTFAFDDETGRVLDEFGVTVDGVTYEVEVGEDGTVSVSEDEGEDESDDESEGDEPEGDDDADDEADDDDDADDVDDVEPLSEDDEDDEDDEADDEGHGEVVSTVAQCAPTGKEAREAGLPNHGVFVSAAAKGEEVDFEVDGEAHTADLSSQEGADAFCELADQLLADAAADLAATEAGEDDGTSDDEGKDRGNGTGKGRADAPGQLKKDG